MTPFAQFFDGNLFVINLARRPDRLENFTRVMDGLGLEFERFEAIDAGPNDGNTGCCASHKAVLDLIVQRGLERAVVFEDDSVLRPEFTDTFHADVMLPLRELPEGWDVLYLGGGYGDDPQGWHSKHLIRINAMKTTSSYAVTAKSARELRDYIPSPCSDGIDNIFSGYTPTHNSFICEPRFFIQYENFSDLQQAKLFNGASMMDTAHVKRLGKYLKS
jgi:GR25 family glycosyltransferase involved in LPS biosynthesis